MWDTKYRWWEERIEKFIKTLKMKNVDERFIPEVLGLMDEDYRAELAVLQAENDKLKRKIRGESGDEWLSRMQQSLLIQTVRQLLGAYDMPLRLMTKYVQTGEIDQMSAGAVLSFTMAMFEARGIPLPPALQEFKDANGGPVHSAGDDESEEREQGAGEQESVSSSSGGEARKQPVEA